MFHVAEPFCCESRPLRPFDFYFEGLRTGVLDIETTGLSPDRAGFVLGGLYTFEDGIFRQFFAESIREEAEALRALLQRLSALDAVITYNGRRFDLPFLKQRAHRLGIPFPDGRLYNLDLYAVLRGHSSLGRILPNLKQKTVESFLGLWTCRADEISGGESAEMYFRYVKNRDPELRRLILLHNRDDVLQLARLLAVLNKTDFHEAMYALGHPVASSAGGLLADIRKISVSDRLLQASGITFRFPQGYRAYGNSRAEYRAVIDETGALSLAFPLRAYRGSGFLDLLALDLDPEPFERYAHFENGFLILKNPESVNCQEVNHFIKLFLNALEVV